MAVTTGIEWTDATWNPVTGCDEVSPGCDHCYAKTFAERWRGTPGHYFENGFDVQLRPDKLTLPLTWRKPKKIFVNSMSDLFHKDVPDEYVAKAFVVMALAPQHTFQVLTKRPARMRSLLSSGQKWRDLLNDAHSWAVHIDLPIAADRFLSVHKWIYGSGIWSDGVAPLGNVWLGTSVESQKWADIRIPALLGTPAAVRFLSCEPLLGPLDLTPWMPPVAPMPAEKAPKSWSDWVWPAWVPVKVREAIEDFWSDDNSRGPKRWIQDSLVQGAPAFGAHVTMDDGFGPNPAQTSGRYVHAWNNIGRLAREDGSFAYTSFNCARVQKERGLHWVIVGGESGSGARPMAPAWARSLRDQCLAADVPYLFKQWGAWSPTGATGMGNPKPNRLFVGPPVDELGVTGEEIVRTSKHAAGRELDGRTWDEYPAVSA